MNYQLLQTLLTHLAQHEAGRGEAQPASLVSFVGYLNQQVFETPRQDTPAEETTETIDSILTKLISYLYRYSKGYIKKALEKSELTTLDDFTYLAGIWKMNGCSKTEIIEKNIHEKTTGTEILKRLLTNDLITQSDDQTDRRSKRVVITEKGKLALFGTFDEMRKASTLVGGKLNETEKLQLLHLLQKLDDFHKPIFMNDRDQPLDAFLALI